MKLKFLGILYDTILVHDHMNTETRFMLTISMNILQWQIHVALKIFTVSMTVIAEI
jgi:hypothetical protein